MKMFRIEGLRWAIFLVAMLLMPCDARAGLIGDNVTATLTDLTPPTANAFSATAMVVDPGVEFSGNFPVSGPIQSHWTLDILDNGFRLEGACFANLDCNFTSGLRLTLSSLNFSPPAVLTGLTGFSTGGAADLMLNGSPQVTASSIIINFQAFQLTTSTPEAPDTTFAAASFTTVPVVATAEPATVFLVVLGALGLGILGLRRVLN